MSIVPTNMHIFTLSKKVFIRWALGMTLFVLLTAPVAVSFDTQTVVLNCGDGCALSLSVPLPTFFAGEALALVGEYIGSFIGNLILSIAAFFTWVAGHMLDASLKYVVFEMGSLINDSGFGLAIDNIWIIIRDICNLAFIFGFIYLGIRTIIDPESASVKRTLTQIIIGALLINFSLFIVKFVIDFSNLVSFHVYNAMISGSGSLSMKIFDMLGLVTFYNDGVKAASLSDMSAGGMIWYYIMGALLLFIAAFVFFAAAILLIVRFVALIFIMIASPVLFAATVFPKTEEYSKKLWGHLISYSLFAPLYLLLTLVTILLMGGLLPVLMPLGPNMSDVLTNSKAKTDAFTVFIAFTVMIFFLVESLLIAKKVGGAGSDFAMKKAGAITMGGAAFMGRHTFGRYFQNKATSKELLDRAGGTGARGWIARQQLKASRAVGDASFDARNIKSVNNALGTGAGVSGGFATAKKKADEKEAAFAKSLGEVDDGDDVYVKMRKTEQVKAEDEIRVKKRELEFIPKNDSRYKETLDEIDALEKKVQKAKEQYGQEKNRRVLGSTFTEKGHDAMVKEAKDQIDIAIKEYKDSLALIETTQQEYLKATDDFARGVAQSRMKKEEERSKKLKADIKKAKDDYTSRKATKSTAGGGYVNTLKNARFYDSWIIGRSVAEEKKSGAAIEKVFRAKFTKTKDELQNEAILEELKKVKS
jgi:hypothetical protein